MKTARVLIEMGEDGTFGAYMPDDNGLPYGVIGEGNTPNEARKDFTDVYNDMRDAACAEGRKFEEVEFKWGYDVPSFLSYYAGLISKAGLARLTGINQSQLSQYISGYRRPSPKTALRIQDALRRLGAELSSVTLT